MADSGEAGGGKKGGVIALAVLTLVAAGAGAAHGVQTFKIIEAAGPVKPHPEPEPEVAAASGHGEAAPAGGGHGAPAPKPAEKKKLPPKIVTRAFQPLITNITMPADLWVRLEGAIVYDQSEVDEPEVMIAEVSGDLLAYLRSLTLREMQGADGLMFIRQDMRERISLRTHGKARDIIIQTLVVQ